MKKDLPIGIFDSGIGGLTVANAVKKILPNESILYFGDTQHLPYGEKSVEAIQQFSKRITEFLIKKSIFFKRNHIIQRKRKKKSEKITCGA